MLLNCLCRNSGLGMKSWLICMRRGWVMQAIRILSLRGQTTGEMVWFFFFFFALAVVMSDAMVGSCLWQVERQRSRFESKFLDTTLVTVIVITVHWMYRKSWFEYNGRVDSFLLLCLETTIHGMVSSYLSFPNQLWWSLLINQCTYCKVLHFKCIV